MASLIFLTAPLLVATLLAVLVRTSHTLRLPSLSPRTIRSDFQAMHVMVARLASAGTLVSELTSH